MYYRRVPIYFLFSLAIFLTVASCSQDSGDTLKQNDAGIDFDAGETLEEQVEEVDVFITAMEENFGHSYVIGSESSWDKEEYLNDPNPHNCQGEGIYTTRITATFNDGMDPGEAQDKFNKMMDDLGIPERTPVFDSDNSDQFYVTTVYENRPIFIRAMDDFLRIIYSAPCSSDESLQEAADYR